MHWKWKNKGEKVVRVKQIDNSNFLKAEIEKNSTNYKWVY